MIASCYEYLRVMRTCRFLFLGSQLYFVRVGAVGAVGWSLTRTEKKRMEMFSVSDDLTEMMVGHTENFNGGAFLVKSTPTLII